MGYLPVVEDDQATGKLKEVYDYIRIVRKQKRVSPVLKAFSMKAELLEQVVKLSDLATFGGTSLSRRWEEILSTAVSTWNGCHY
ncbi:MAG: hypothetical protein A3H94_05445 [Acidobacteria bacterium RIFCSPLOWO2_02_FULL_60_20]|nr:MAG: hypothetical protein A3H94_05445 [Acidobacteria bacterium RIFCSPLOWO2_02_FULL_60_20]